MQSYFPPFHFDCSSHGRSCGQTLNITMRYNSGESNKDLVGLA